MPISLNAQKIKERQKIQIRLATIHERDQSTMKQRHDTICRNAPLTIVSEARKKLNCALSTV